MIRTGQVGVVTRFGGVTGRELSEGLHVVLPIGIERVSRYDVRVLKEETQDVAAATQDLQDVRATVVLNYRLDRNQVSEIHKTIGRDFREKLIDPATSETFKAAASRFTASEMITSRAAVKKDAYEALKSRLYRYGVIVEDLSITNFSFSDAFTKAIEDKQVAQQNAERAKFNLEAAKTDAQAQEAQRQTLSPELLQKWAIEKWDGKMPQYTGGGTVFNIPLQ
jgi:regulator of protease activity HflC (stomatin/prohibitin superfamily)